MNKTGSSATGTVTYYPAGGAMSKIPRPAGRINIVGGSNILYYILKDHLGSASVVTDSTGTVVGEQRYYPYGETRFTSGTIYTDKLFTGQRDVGLGIYHYGARFYSPKTGRFLSPDTIVPSPANPQNLNRYMYVLGNPLRYTDPTGHSVACDEAPTLCGGSGGGGSSGGGGTGGGGTDGGGGGGGTGGGGNGGGGECGAGGMYDCPPAPTSSPPSETLTTVLIGGVNPASVPGVQDDDGVPTITNLQGSTAIGIPMIISMINSLAQSPASSSDVDILLSYITSGNGSIDNMIVTINNHNGGSAVDLSGVIITTDPLLTSGDSVYLRPTSLISVSPGQIENTAICSNCIAEHTLSFDMPIDSTTEVTITVMVGAVYNFGYPGTNYGQLPVSYTIPPR